MGNVNKGGQWGSKLRGNSAKEMALGGVLAALSVVIMCLGGLIPVATYVSPVLCIILGSIVARVCGKRIAFAWYGAVAVLSLLLAPDKEAVAVYVFLGNYPVLKPWFSRYRLGTLLKLLYFNAAITVMYAIILYVLGMERLLLEFQGFGVIGAVVLLILGNITFFFLDRLLDRFL